MLDVLSVTNTNRFGDIIIYKFLSYYNFPLRNFQLHGFLSNLDINFCLFSDRNPMPDMTAFEK